MRQTTLRRGSAGLTTWSGLSRIHADRDSSHVKIPELLSRIVKPVFPGLSACHLMEDREFEHLRVGDEFVYTEGVNFEGYYVYNYRCARHLINIDGDRYMRNDGSDWCARNGVVSI